MRTAIFIISSAALALPLHLLAQAPAGNPQAKSLAPLIDNTTFIVTRFDLTKPDCEEFAFVVSTTEQIFVMNTSLYSILAKELFTGLRKAGAREFYAVYGFFGTMPIYATPLGDGVNEKSILALFGPDSVFGDIRAEKIGDAVVMGKSDMLEHFRKRAPSPRPEFITAFDVFGGMTCQVAVAISPDVRRAFEEMIPTFPKELGGGSTTLLTRDMKWASLGLSGGPNGMKSLNLKMQATDEAAAGRVDAWFPAFLKSFKTGSLKEGPQTQEFKDMWSKFEQAIPGRGQVGDAVVLQLNAQTTAALLQPFIHMSRDDARLRTITYSRLRDIGRTLHTYHDQNKSFPQSASYDKQGKPLLSWRVHLLPYMEQEALYRQFKLDEPWDSEHNKKLISKIPLTYRDAMGKGAAEGKTPFLVPVGKETIFPPGEKGVTLGQITKDDGTANTLMVLQVADESMVIWTKPEDWQFDPKDPHQGLVDKNRPSFGVAFADVHVRQFENNVSAQTLRAYITRNAGDDPYEKKKK